MSYRKSATDLNNLEWFHTDKGRNTLTDITIDGSIRGLTNTTFHMDYPISAIAGKNGCGKSTLLALTACAFHNTTPYTEFIQKKKYYTFGDFFAFAAGEPGIAGVKIQYNVITPSGEKTDIRHKKPSGKWNDYNTRFQRKVAFMGINRIVPPSESSVHKTYKRAFKRSASDATLERKITGHMSRIFGRTYDHMSILSYGTYHLFELEKNPLQYTGFNMGAGENAILQLLVELYLIGKGGLLVIDEIELGLHVEAQKALVKELKEICKEQHCQIICSTHSQYILDALPPEGRFLIENHELGNTSIANKISSEYAFGKMAGQTTHELTVFTEDVVGAKIVAAFIPSALRERIDIIPIGSDEAVIRQIAARYRENKMCCIAFMDGDKHNCKERHIREIRNALETRIKDDFEDWVQNAVNYLPGEEWPERHIIERAECETAITYLADKWDATPESIRELLTAGKAAAKHNEIYTIAQKINLSLDSVWADIIYAVKKAAPDDAKTVIEPIERALSTIV